MLTKLTIVICILALYTVNGGDLELSYLFPSMIHEPAMKLIPPFQQEVYYYSFEVPVASKLYGPNVAFYLFAGQPSSKTAEIIINQDQQFFQSLTAKQYWQSNKVPFPLSINKTTIDLHIQDGTDVGTTYTIHVIRAATQ